MSNRNHISFFEWLRIRRKTPKRRAVYNRGDPLPGTASHFLQPFIMFLIAVALGILMVIFK